MVKNDDMTAPERTLTTYLDKNRSNFNKMLIVTGPRQVGKTTLIQRWPEVLGFPKWAYLNWDIPEDRKVLRAPTLAYFRERAIPNQPKPLFLLDEIHKNRRWKNYLKGLFDALKDQAHFVVTGSGRMDVYRRGGESLLGRYWLFHLFPFTVAEAAGTASFTMPTTWPESNRPEWQDCYNTLFHCGGFPEPFFAGDETTHGRWAIFRRESLLREDLRDLSRIMEMALVENLLDLLPRNIGAPLSVNALREDLEVSHHTVKNWLRWLEVLYYVFFVPVYAKNLARSLKREQKLYLYNWAEIADLGARFENLVALHLLKAVHGYREFCGEDLRLYYLRDRERREVDFCIVRKGRPWLLLEAKASPDPSPSSLVYFAERLHPEHVVMVTHEPVDPQWKVFRDRRYWLSPAATFFANWL